jgi:hypothetical protein
MVKRLHKITASPRLAPRPASAEQSMRVAMPSSPYRQVATASAPTATAPSSGVAARITVQNPAVRQPVSRSPFH